MPLDIDVEVHLFSITEHRHLLIDYTPMIQLLAIHADACSCHPHTCQSMPAAARNMVHVPTTCQLHELFMALAWISTDHIEHTRA